MSCFHFGTSLYTCRHPKHCVIFLMICCPALDTIEKEMRSLFNIPSEKETRLWNKYMSNTYEQLNKPDSTVQDAGLFQGQVRHCSRHNTPFFIHSLISTIRLCVQPGSSKLFSHSLLEWKRFSKQKKK